MSGLDEARGELALLVQSARALLLAHRDAGTVGFPDGDGHAPSAAAGAFDEAAWAAGQGADQADAARPLPYDALPQGNTPPEAWQQPPPPPQAAAQAASPAAPAAAAPTALNAPPPAYAPPPLAPPSSAPSAGSPRALTHEIPTSGSFARMPASGPMPAAPVAAAPAPPAHRQADPRSFPPDAHASGTQPRPAAAPMLASGGVAPRTDAALARLQVLSTEIASCTACGLHAGRKRTVFARGNPLSELCFIGEGPGADEDEQGLPFVGRAGQLLDRMIAAMGFGRDDVYICNVVRCRPPQNRTPTPEEMATCIPYLHEQIALAQPKAIVALGATAAKGLLGVGMGIRAMRGQWRLYRATIPVMPTFHPAYLLREPTAKREVWTDLQAVLERLGRPLPKRGGA
jgi:uracil-DNA glycosylase